MLRIELIEVAELGAGQEGVAEVCECIGSGLVTFFGECFLVEFHGMLESSYPQKGTHKQVHLFQKSFELRGS